MVVHKTFLCAKMLMHKESYEVEIGGKKLIAEFTDLADQAHGSVIMRYGNTTVLATAVMSAKKRDAERRHSRGNQSLAAPCEE